MSLFEQGGQHVGTQYNAARDINIHPPDKQNQADLRILLGNVERTWLDGVFDNSLYNQVLLSLGKELRAEAIDHPWSMVFENPAQERKSLPPEKKIKEIFLDDANRLLLILGEPGSGKTITLLQLARELISDLKQATTFTQPIPVIFNLSTWTNKKQPLTDWLVMELLSKYRVPKKQGRRWLEEQRILPLLDGLDEVKAENRAACVEQINQLTGEYGLHGLVVCSRFKEYNALEVRLQFSGAIYLQPLTATQINQYLSQIGDKLTGLRQALPQDEVLQELAHSPLMLNIMSLAYEDRLAEEIIVPDLDSVEVRRPHLFDTYIRRMFQHKGERYSQHKEEIKKRLAWLAWNMERHNQEIFLIEGLQPSWLTKRRWRWAYILASRVTGIFLFFTSILIYLFLNLNFEIYKFMISNIKFHVMFSAFVFLCSMLYNEEIEKKFILNNKLLFFFSYLLALIVILIIFSTLPIVILLDYFFGIRGSKQDLVSDIHTVESLKFKIQVNYYLLDFIDGLIKSLFFLIPVSILTLFFEGFSLFKDKILGLFISFIIINIFFYYSYYNLSFKRVVEYEKQTPNQGIRLSIKNAVLGGLLVSMINFLFVILFILFTDIAIVYSNFNFSISSALLLGVIGALWYGCFDVIKHYTLRAILIFQGHTPRKYADFLDDAAKLIFLQKVGGGYRFIHRLLRDHFAKMCPDEEGSEEQGSESDGNP